MDKIILGGFFPPNKHKTTTKTMDKIIYGYNVELREPTSNGYTEEWYDFDTKDEALEFARENKSYLYSISDYESVQRNHDPIDITNEI